MAHFLYLSFSTLNTKKCRFLSETCPMPVSCYSQQRSPTTISALIFNFNRPTPIDKSFSQLLLKCISLYHVPSTIPHLPSAFITSLYPSVLLLFFHQSTIISKSFALLPIYNSASTEPLVLSRKNIHLEKAQI